MMNTLELNVQPASNKWWAARDAQRYSDQCRVIWSASDRARAETFRDILALARTGVRTEITYRKGFMVVKAERSEVRDRRVLKEVEALAAERGYLRVVTPQAISYRIK
jgi:hypothetical protein